MSAATPIIVHSRAELERLMWDNPIQLRAARPDRGPRVGHPDFIGPIDPRFMARIGRITFAEDGTAEFNARAGRPAAQGTVRAAEGVTIEPLSSPSRSPEGGNEPSGRASGAEPESVGPIPSREAGGPPLADHQDRSRYLQLGAANGGAS